MRSFARCLAVIVLANPFAIPDVFGQSPVMRGVTRVEDTPRYRRSWAIVIGINYSHFTGALAAEVPTLKTAENDAREFHARLIANYGFTTETTRLLLGDQATGEAIRQLFGDGFLGDNDKVRPDDCVLFYFAGHGNRRERTAAREQHVGLLYPADLRFVPGKGVDTVSCLRIDEIVTYLRDYCAARHKLVILDSCHSGEIFNFQTNRNSAVARTFRAALFLKPSFQALSAARGDQAAADADPTGKHSPVTRVLFDALDGGLAKDRKFFTASELFSYLPERVSAMPGVRQDPRGGWIAGEGDFYFFPTALKREDFPEGEIDAWKSQSASLSRAQTPTPPSEFPSLPVILGAVLAGGIVLGGVFLLKRRRLPATSTRLADGAIPLSTTPPLMFRIRGTSYVYHADAQSELLTVGRQKRKPGSTADEGNDLVIRGDLDELTLKISRRHLEIVRRGEALFVVDRSSHGTWLNGSRLPRDREMPLRPGDVLDLANTIQLELLAGKPQGRVTNREMRLGQPQAPGKPGLILEVSVGDMRTVDPAPGSGEQTPGDPDATTGPPG